MSKLDEACAKMDSVCARLDAGEAPPKYRVGQTVHFKYGIEQSGKITAVKHGRWGSSHTYTVLAFEGYAEGSRNGVGVDFGEEELW